MRLARTSEDAPPSGVEAKKAHRLWEPTLQAVRMVANVPHRKCLRARVQSGCTTKRYAIKQGLIACVRGLNPPVLKRKICPLPCLDKTRSAEPGSALEANGASEPSCASLGQGPRRYSQCLPGRHRNDRRDTGLQYKKMKLENPPTLASELSSLPVTSWRHFARHLHDGRIEQICILSGVERMKCEAEELK
ncbi:hypothetical protein PF008_g12867 [Phytophthora fragariae]|uniref:Uncharacterized protein n=1 Tax=Phytophthora fragariae TaxID=53985 RepID=A0A6G0RN14_9STRA|nr:hypothetical protein PF008_g12867 [Phytophthora fragariae]